MQRPEDETGRLCTTSDLWMNTGTGVPVRHAVRHANARAFVRCARNRAPYGHHFARVQQMRARLRRQGPNGYRGDPNTERVGGATHTGPSVDGRHESPDHKRARVCQMRAESPVIRSPFRARSANARAFAKTGSRRGRTKPNWPSPEEPSRAGAKRSPAGANRPAAIAAVSGTCCRGTRLGSLRFARPGNVCAATLLRDRLQGFAARWWCRAMRWHRR